MTGWIAWHIALVGLAQVTDLAATGDNLAKNPSFEIIADGAAFPTDWRANHTTYSRDTATVRSGNASLRYENDNTNAYRLCTQSVPLVAGHRYRFGAWVKTENIQGGESGATLCIEWRDTQGKWLGGAYPTGVKGSHDWQRVEGLATVPTNAGACTLSCYVRRGMTGTAWFDAIDVRRVVGPVMRSALLAPGYRGWLPAAGKQRAHVRVWLNPDEHELKPGQVSLGAHLAGDKTTRPCASLSLATADLSQPVDMEIDLGEKLAPGRYTLQIDLLAANGTRLHTTAHALTAPDGTLRPRVTIDPHGRCIVDGKPMLPLGMYWSGIKADELAIYAKSAFNCLMPYGRPKPEQMDLAHELGLKVIYSVKDLYYGSRWCPGFVKSTADEEAHIRRYVRQFRDHPALLAWYLNDELPLTYREQLTAHQRWVTEEDPHHPTWVVLYQYRDVRDYLGTFDVIGTDPYPIGRAPASEAGAWTAETRRQVCGARPLWQVPQLHNWINYRKDHKDADRYHTPTRNEVRSMAWQCLCEGAMGLVFYSWHDVRRNPDVPFDTQWAYLKEIAAEIDAAAPALLSVAPCPPVTVTATPAQPTWLHWLARRHGDTLFVFAVNNGDAEGTLTIALPDTWRAVKNATGAATHTMTAGGFTDPLPSLQVRIYEIRQNPYPRDGTATGAAGSRPAGHKGVRP